MSRDFDSNPEISVNLSRDWTSLGWQVAMSIWVKFLSMQLREFHIPDYYITGCIHFLATAYCPMNLT